MRKHLKKFVAIIMLVIIAGLLIWRLYPRTFDSLISSDTKAITSLACSVSISGISDDGTTFIDCYQLQALDKNSEDFRKIINIIKHSEYCQDFQNLLPWSITSVSGGDHSGKIASIFLAWGNTERDTCFLTFHSNGKVIVSAGDSSGFFVYHTTDKNTSDNLISYLQEHGIKQ